MRLAIYSWLVVAGAAAGQPLAPPAGWHGLTDAVGDPAVTPTRKDEPKHPWTQPGVFPSSFKVRVEDKIGRVHQVLCSMVPWKEQGRPCLRWSFTGARHSPYTDAWPIIVLLDPESGRLIETQEVVKLHIVHGPVMGPSMMGAGNPLMAAYLVEKSRTFRAGLHYVNKLRPACPDFAEEPFAFVIRPGMPIEVLPWVASFEARPYRAGMEMTYTMEQVGKRVFLEAVYEKQGREVMRVWQCWVQGERWWRQYERWLGREFDMRSWNELTPEEHDLFLLEREPRLTLPVRVPAGSGLPEALEALSAATGMVMDCDPKLSDHRPNLDDLKLDGMRARLVMHALAQHMLDKGRWESMPGGYRLTARRSWVEPPLSPRPKKANEADDQGPFPLRRDNRLRATIDVVEDNPDFHELLDRLRKATELELTLTGNLARHEPRYGRMQLPRLAAYSLMEIMAAKQMEDGRWEKTAKGYRLVGRSLALRPVEWDRLWVGVGGFLIGAAAGIGLGYVRRRRSQRAG